MAWPTTVDYSGRQVDVELLQTISQPVGSVPVTISLAKSTPRVVTGIEKAVQRYVVLLLSLLENIKFAPDQGTTFFQDMIHGAAYNPGTIGQTFAFANAEALGQMREEDEETYGTVPDDENVVEATLVDYNVDYATSTLLLRVQLTTAAGDDYMFVLPTTVPRT